MVQKGKSQQRCHIGKVHGFDICIHEYRSWCDIGLGVYIKCGVIGGQVLDSLWQHPSSFGLVFISVVGYFSGLIEAIGGSRRHA